MTDAIAASPALASLVLAVNANATAGATTSATAAVPDSEASPQTEAAQAGFNALLLGLQAPVGPAQAATGPVADAIRGGAGCAATDAAAAAPDLLSTTPDAVAAGAPPRAPRPGGADPRSGKADGEDAPDGGTDLPQAGPDLLAQLFGPPALAASGAVVHAAPPPATPSTDGVALAEPAVEAAAPARGAAGPATTGQAAAGAPAADSAPLAGDAAAAATRTGDVPAATGLASDAARGKDTGADRPADVRAGFETVLADAGRTMAPAADAGPGPGGLTVTAAAPAATTLGHAPAMAGAGTGADALPGSLPTLQPAGDREAWAQGLGERLLMMADKGLQSATLRLQPEHLGPMEIRISVSEDGSAQVLFSAHHGQTREALESAIPRLRELFADQGLSLAQANVDAGRSGSFAQRGFDAEAGARDGWTRGEPATPAADDGPAWRPVRSTSRRLDVTV